MNIETLSTRQWEDDSPFQVTVAGATFVGEQVLRLVPGKRLVASGTWQGQPVVAKIFFNDGGQHARPESETLTMLAEQAMPVPGVLKLYQQGPHAVLLLEKLPGSDLQTVLGAGFDPELVGRMLNLVWELFRLGWVQKDLHPGNFMVSEAGLYCIDAGEMKRVVSFDPRALKNNLALLAVQFQLPFQQPLVREIKKAMEGWGLNSEGFDASCQRLLSRRVIKADRKWTRNCTAVSVELQPDRTVYLNRQWREQADELLALCERSSGLSLIKEGRRVRVTGNDQWVVKHYHSMGWKGRLRQKLGLSHGMTSWRRGLTWSLLGVPTPEPVLLVEFTQGEQAGQSIIVCPKFSGIRLSEIMETHRNNASIVADKVREWLALFQWAGLSHGDMKAQNILVSAGGEICFIDLDAASVRDGGLLGQGGNKKDRLRFEKNWEQFRANS